MLNFGTFPGISVKTNFWVVVGGFGTKWPPGPMQNHMNYCCFCMPATRHELLQKTRNSTKSMEFHIIYGIQ